MLRAFNVEYRTVGGLRLPVYVEIGLMPPETKDWVKIEPGLRHVLTVPDTMNMILTGVGVTTSLNSVYQSAK